MPNKTGDKLAAELIRIKPEIRIILCTGYSGGISDESSVKIGINAFLIKPLLIQELATTVRTALGEA